MRYHHLHLLSGVFASVALSACVAELDVSSTQMPVEALCSFPINTGGTTKTVEMESDYLPHVLACEARADAGLQTLMAQAVAARSFLIYKFTTPYPADRVSVAGDGQSFQVYGCGTFEGLSQARRDLIVNAVSSTAGQVLTFENHIICSFFASGAITQASNGCYYQSGDSDPLGTEKHITYNEGKTGDDKEKSSQGGDNPYNQGSMSQNGAHCLEGIGYDYRRILGFYYGADVYVGNVVGSCGTGPVCTPTGPEICGDGVDNDCQDGPDDGCPPPCVKTSEVEDCSNEKDDNCNGYINEGCAEPPPSCIPSGLERCDGKDNDCQNGVDDGNPGGDAFCTRPGQIGPCASGKTRCQGGVLECVATYTSSSETCNNVDDDCNGLIDDVPGGCGSGCTPQPEICNGVDDDCNGVPDDGNPQGGQVCYPGSCPQGLTACVDGVVVCHPTPSPELCDGLDNDCNGFIDDAPGGCVPNCTPQGPEICDRKDNDCNGYTDDVVGGCTPGCTPNGAEVCDNVDNDCNGFTDDVPGGCSPSQCVITGLESCDGRDNDCNGVIDDVVGGCVPSCVPNGDEICDGIDNDCNGLTDDALGGCIAAPPPISCQPQREMCNGRDDDCDGFPDEGNPDGGDECTVYTASQPFKGLMMCISGMLVCRVTDPGTRAFTDSLRVIRGAGCATAGESLRALPPLSLLALLFWALARRRRRRC